MVDDLRQFHAAPSFFFPFLLLVFSLFSACPVMYSHLRARTCKVSPLLINQSQQLLDLSEKKILVCYSNSIAIEVAML
jgi:hypothetical protein